MALSLAGDVVTLAEALEQIQSDKIDDRRKGLENLKNILTYNRTQAKLQQLAEKSIHAIFEALFRANSTERVSYNRGSKSTAKAASASRIALGASVLRLTVTLFTHQLRRKTVKALLGHIIQTLPNNDGGYCEPLALEYLKSLNAILTYQAHVEHVDEGLWLDVVDFCIEGVEIPADYGVLDDTGTPDGSSRLPSFRSQSSAFWKATRAASIENVVEILGCLRSLAWAPNSPILERAQIILPTIIAFLKNSASITFGHHAAMQTINASLKRVIINSSSLVYEFMPELISIFKSLWARARAEYSLTDELLICLLHLQPFIMSAVKTARGNLYLSDMESLLEVMLIEYCAPRKEERGHLELMDLGLDMRERPTLDAIPMQTTSFYLGKATTKSERNWTELHFIAFLVVWIDQQRSLPSRAVPDDNENVTLPKRRKLNRKLEEIIEETATKMTLNRIYYLHVLAFVAAQRKLVTNDLKLMLESLILNASQSNSDVVSWALMAIASCVHHPHANGEGFRDYWTTAWQLSVRLISSVPSCRAACHVLYALLSQRRLDYVDVVESIDIIWSSANFDGPGLLCDSAVNACLLMSTLKAFHDPGSARDSSEQMIAWICAKWTPSSFENKAYADQVRRCTPSKSIYAAFQIACQGDWRMYTSTQFACLNAMGEAWHDHWKNAEVLEYLLLLEAGTLFPQPQSNPPQHPEHVKYMEIRKQDSPHPVTFSFLRTELDKISEIWKSTKNPNTINGDMVQVVFAFCLVALLICNENFYRPSTKVSALIGSINELANDVIQFSFKRHIYHHDRVAALLDTVHQFLPRVDNEETINTLTSKIGSLISVFQSLAEALKEEHKRIEDSLADAPSHGDIFDSGVGSQVIQPIYERPMGSDRRMGSAQSGSRSFFASISSFVILLGHASAATTDGLTYAFVPTAYIEYILALPESEFLSSWPMVKLLMNTALQFRPSDAEMLIVHLAKSFIATYAWSRDEGALCLCLDVLVGTATLWTDQTFESLAEAAADIYIWFIDAGSKMHVLAPHVQIAFSDLLYKLLDIRPDFAQGVSRPSVRTTLFGILGHCEIDVKYHIAQRLPIVFSSFVVSQHAPIFEDVHTSLPNNVDWTEGVAIRVLAHTQLGCSWTSLLRRCLYHVFEIAGEGGVAEPFAISSVKRLVSTLAVGSPQDLFRLFSPQLLYTWLQTQNLTTIPFKIFGYVSIRELLMGSKAEVLSQIVMRGSDTELKSLEQILGRPIRNLLQECFPQALAYGLAKDVVTLSEGGGASHDAESCIRDLLGREEYLRLLEENFHLVVGHLFLRLDKEDQMDRTLWKREGYETPNKALGVMKSISSSNVSLPADQQPDFKPRAVLEAIERACRRVNDAAKKGIVRNEASRKNVLNVWTPLLFLTVSRMILNDIHPVFGSSHSCHAIRKLRIAVCLAGPSALVGYPLEMLLHAVRPYLSDELCADDAFGLYQYLLDNGKDSLLGNGAFVAGLCLTTFLTLEQFLRSTQDSTTQENDHVATMSKARVFHGWLSRYLDTYSPQNTDPALQRAFKTTIDTARRISNPVNAFSSSPESKLLLTVLDHLKFPKPLLSKKALEICFYKIFESFSAPDNFRDDVLGREEDAKKYHLPIWKSLEFHSVSRSYNIWAGKILGRSFGHDGELASDVYAETRLKALSAMSDEQGDGTSSKIAIISSFVELLQGESSHGAGLAEYSLQSCLQAYSDTPEMSLLEDCLPPSFANILLSENFVLLYEYPLNMSDDKNVTDCLRNVGRQPFDSWICDLTIAIISLTSNEPLFQTLPVMLSVNEGLAGHLFPFVLHLALARQTNDANRLQQSLSEGFHFCFKTVQPTAIPHVKTLLNSLLYLRTQSRSNEHTSFDRNGWLSLDCYTVASAAAQCNMYKTALLFIDTAQTSKLASSEIEKNEQASQEMDLFQAIFSELDEPDSFYGVEQKPDLESLIDRHAFEGNGIQGLLFRSAQVDSHSRRRLADQPIASAKLIQSLARVNLNCLTRNVAVGQGSFGTNQAITESAVNAALKLGQWDIPVPSSNSTSAILYRTFQAASNAPDVKGVIESLDIGILDGLKQFRGLTNNSPRSLSSIGVIASLTEIYELLASRDVAQIDEVIQKLQFRDQWMKVNRVDVISPMLISRAAFVGILGRSPPLRSLMHLKPRDICRIEVDLELRSSSIYSTLGGLQESLSIIAYLSDQIDPYYQANGLKVDGAIKSEIANVLWERGEHIPSIQVLRDIVKSCNFNDQTIPVGLAETLATLGQRVSHARLENPGDIVEKYLWPALTELQKDKSGPEVAHVFHEYASYCHNQLINNENVEEFRRSERFKRQKAAEIQELRAALATSKTSREKQITDKAIKEAQKWYALDKQENERLRANREENLKQSLMSYLQTLKASDAYNTDVIKFTALWYEFSDSETANVAVKNVIDKVPSRKFAPLMNQFSSRLQQSGDSFQTILSNLIERICHDHPHHGMNHVFAGSKTSGGNDSQARSRNRGAVDIASRLANDPKTNKIWHAILKSNDLYMKMAKFKNDDLKRANSKFLLRKIDASRRVERDIPTLHVPPITISIDIRDDFDYTSVPVVAGFKPEMSILGGLSAPKLLTVIDSAGKQHRQLFKGGSDDLRQDAIMEQVFGQVTDLLHANKATRQRKLRIRTYKVVPLDATSGAIEFVQPTISLLDYLMPAHNTYNPNEYNWKACRDKIEKGQDLPQASRIKIFQDVKQRFTPVLRHFFFERFKDPDDWFDRRLAYTRSTAAISILGHVLGLGDRHCQNILLDTSTGEVVHIDLGVAFEAGRILPKPETVPFRLTRDIIDGFGALKTEGVFRRCCEFTLEALRHNKDTIMTLLNVLRYDPLYSWSVSPLRARRMQEEQQLAAEGQVGAMAAPSSSKSGTRRSSSVIAGAEALEVVMAEQLAPKNGDEGGEADRALSVVERKLAAGLSVAAAVNELIQQATDDRNLAVLFHGWAAYA